MNKFWENLNIRLAAPRKKKEEIPPGPLPGDNYSYMGIPDKDEYYFDGPHPTARLGKGSWQTLQDGTEVFVDQKGNVRAGGNHEWHGKPFDAVNKEHTRNLAMLPPEERANLQPVRPTGKFLPREDGKLKVDPSIRDKYQPQINQNLEWAADKNRLKDRVAARMIAENHHKIDQSNGISFFPFKDYSPAHQDALAAAHAQSEQMGDLADIKDPNARLEWAKNHATNLDNLVNGLDTANLGDGVNLVGSRADEAKQYVTNPSLLDKLTINPSSVIPTVAPVKKTRTKTTPPPEMPAPAPVTPAAEPVAKKTRAPRKSAPEIPAASSRPSFSYPSGRNIIQDDLSRPGNSIKGPPKTLRDTYYIDPKYRREKISASKIIKSIIKKASQ